MAENTATGTAAAAVSQSAQLSQSQDGQPSGPNLTQHTPSLAGSVLECPDSFGGTLLIRVQNMSATADLGVRLDLKQIALRCRNTEFNPRRFAAVIMRLREPRATALVFASGKLVITGTKSTHNSSLATQKMAYILERVGFQAKGYIPFKVQNIVGTVDVGFPIRLEGVAYAHPTFSSYEPELFPGLIYRLEKPKVVLLIFVSGKVVITGGKTEEQLVVALKKVYPVMLEFRKVNVASMPGTAAAARGRESAAESDDASMPALPVAAVAPSKGKGRRGGKGKAAPQRRRGKSLETPSQSASYDV